MIKLMFQKETKYFMIIIDGKRVSCTSPSWHGTVLQYLPKDPKVLKQIVESRNRIAREWLTFFDVQPDELAEFEAAKDELELKEIVLRDCKKFRCKLVEEYK